MPDQTVSAASSTITAPYHHDIAPEHFAGLSSRGQRFLPSRANRSGTQADSDNYTQDPQRYRLPVGASSELVPKKILPGKCNFSYLETASLEVRSNRKVWEVVPAKQSDVPPHGQGMSGASTNGDRYLGKKYPKAIEKVSEKLVLSEPAIKHADYDYQKPSKSRVLNSNLKGTQATVEKNTAAGSYLFGRVTGSERSMALEHGLTTISGRGVKGNCRPRDNLGLYGL